jgi:hypothetical protein
MEFETLTSKSAFSLFFNDFGNLTIIAALKTETVPSTV